MKIPKKLLSLKHFVPVKDASHVNKYQLVPKWPFRLLVCGNSGSGKTNLLLNLVLQYLSFDRLIVFAKDLSEPKYEFLQKLLEDEPAAEFSSDDQFITVDDLDPNQQNLIVFDDYVTTKNQKAIEDLFIRGRKKNASIVYLTQSYYKTPKNIRLQCNYLALF